ncbi:MAG: bifunctional adenosylcobinamide kinase/adenosylcobinamide-phosphate guanylyltransferase [Candidatus Omnitrophica bacterium]|nr:bifunctional adenosylcobinamide kinase/adenosylcobinamide-phosphate guanylyltransferase [Candidatus Omnitrophota bacterium]
MGKITFIIGGGRSGKSSYALSLAKKYKKVAFIATCAPGDSEMKKRIRLHQKSRPENWQTFEELRDIPAALKRIGPEFNLIIIDCLTLLVSNLFLEGLKEKNIADEIKKTLILLKKIKGHSIIVSNEVGLGIVPQHKLTRDFRDIAGRVNQIVAKEADKAFFMVSGLALKLK